MCHNTKYSVYLPGLVSSLLYSDPDSQVNNLQLYLAVSVLQMPAVTSRSRPCLPQPCQICLHTLRVEQRMRLFPWEGPHHQCWAPTSSVLLTRLPQLLLSRVQFIGPFVTMVSDWCLADWQFSLERRRMEEWSVERVKVMPYHRIKLGKILGYFTVVPQSSADAHLLCFWVIHDGACFSYTASAILSIFIES